MLSGDPDDAWVTPNRFPTLMIHKDVVKIFMKDLASRAQPELPALALKRYLLDQGNLYNSEHNPTLILKSVIS